MHITINMLTCRYRSEDIDLFEVFVPKDSDWDIMNMLGHLDCLHFIDLNKGE